MSRNLGHSAERFAERWLGDKGLKPIERNLHLAGAELDLVMRDGACLVFVEVRHRTQAEYGDAMESVSQSKRRHLARAAQAYMAALDEDMDGRFDVIAINGNLDDGDVEWLADAFDLDDC